MESFGAYVERWVAAPARVLEVGAGAGGLAAELRERGHAGTAAIAELMTTGGLVVVEEF